MKRLSILSAMSSLLLVALFACSRNAPPPPSVAQAVGSAPNAASVTTVEPTVAAVPVAAAIAENQAIHAVDEDYQWDEATAVAITLQGDTIAVAGEGATVDGSTVTITAAGTYRISGTLTEGQIAVDTADEAPVQLILAGVDVHNSTSAALNVIKAEKTVILLAEQTENVLTDGDAYLFANPEEDEPNATLFSKGHITIAGTGSLLVTGHYNDGIASKDGLVIAGGTLTVDAADDGIRGKEYLVVQAGQLTINAQGDGLKADEEENATKGYIAIAGGDALQAALDIAITAGDFVLTAGGGHNSPLAADASAKGIKAAVAVEIDGGTFAIDSADDAIHANASLLISGGVFTLATGDDAIHADASVTINGGEIQITQSYEGIESMVITINDGTIHLVSSDDGINVAGGNDGSAERGPGGGGPRGPRPGQENLAYTGSEYLYLNGGYIVVDSGGDGVDVNGAVEMTGGTVIVNGPTMRMNSALDYDAFFKMTGGFVVAAGSAGMAQAPGTSSTQNAVLVNFNSTLDAGTLVHLQSSDGETLFTFAPTKSYQSIAFASPALVKGESYTLFVGGTATGAATDGLYQEETYRGGAEYTTFTVADTVTLIGTQRR